MTEIRPGVWHIRVYAGRNANGSPIEKCRTFKGGKRAAERGLAKLLTQVGDGKVPIESVTVSGLVERWLEHGETLGRNHRPL